MLAFSDLPSRLQAATPAIQISSVSDFSQQFGHGRDQEVAPTGRDISVKLEIIGELNGSVLQFF